MEVEIQGVKIEGKEVEAVFKLKTSLETMLNKRDWYGFDDGMVQHHVLKQLTEKITDAIYQDKINMVNEKLSDKDLVNAVLSRVAKRVIRTED